MSESIWTKDLLTLIIEQLKKTPLNINLKLNLDIDHLLKQFDIMLNAVLIKLENRDVNVVRDYLKNTTLINECIVPNMQAILADGRINLDDIPYFLNILIGIYESIKRVMISPIYNHSDLVELSGLLVKTVMFLITAPETNLVLAISITDCAIKLLKFNMKN